MTMYRVFFFEIINNAKKTLKQSKENENEYKSDLNEIKTAKKKKKKKKCNIKYRNTLQSTKYCY